MHPPEAKIHPRISVCVVTYNQEKYIEQCIESLIGQETDFDFEIIIADDHSTDRTYEIAKSYSLRYPEIIRLFRHAQNIGPFENFIFSHQQASADLIAHLDGDDYALPGKLQAQVNFMDSNPDCTIAWHRMMIRNDQTGEEYPQYFNLEEIGRYKAHINDVISTITLGLHSSKVYRRGIPHQPAKYLPAIDFSENVLCLLSNGGYAAFIPNNEPLGVYRAFLGISSSTAKIRIIIYKWMKYFFDNRIGDRTVIASKIFAMTASDLKHGIGSLSSGLSTLKSMALYIRPIKVIKILKTKPKASLSQ